MANQNPIRDTMGCLPDKSFETFSVKQIQEKNQTDQFEDENPEFGRKMFSLCVCVFVCTDRLRGKEGGGYY